MGKDIDDGGAAFPYEPHYDLEGRSVPGDRGMTLRDWFAGRAMAEMIRLSTDSEGGWSAENVAYGCYNLADAMLIARSDQ